MFRLSQLKELKHSLSRARSVAEYLELTDIAENTNALIRQVDTHIALEAQANNTGTGKTIPFPSPETKTKTTREPRK